MNNQKWYLPAAIKQSLGQPRGEEVRGPLQHNQKNGYCTTVVDENNIKIVSATIICNNIDIKQYEYFE